MTDLPRPLEPLPPGPAGDDGVPGLDAARDRLRAAGVEPLTWSNGPGEAYASHTHAFEKLLACAKGEITFFVGEDDTPVRLRAGDGFVLPPGTPHAALVGAQGCVCVEGHRR